MTYLEELLWPRLLQLPLQTLGLFDVLFSLAFPVHDLRLAFVVQTLLSDFEDVHCLFVELSFLLREHQLVSLGPVEFFDHLLRALELLIKFDVEVLAFTFLLLYQGQGLVELGLLLVNKVFMLLLFIFGLLFMLSY